MHEHRRDAAMGRWEKGRAGFQFNSNFLRTPLS